MITYICKYTPIELLRAFGAEPEMPNDDAPDFARTESMIHSSVCSHAKMLIDALMRDPGEMLDKTSAASSPGNHLPVQRTKAELAGEENQEDEPDKISQRSNEMVLINCCDSIRRVYDTVPADHFSFRMMLDLPHRTEGFAVDLYARELEKLALEYEQFCGHSFDPTIFLREWKKSADAWKELDERSESGLVSQKQAGFQGEPVGDDVLVPTSIEQQNAVSRNGRRNDRKTGEKGKFIAVMGARPSNELLQRIQECLPYPVVNLTCGGLRSLPEPPENLKKMESFNSQLDESGVGVGESDTAEEKKPGEKKPGEKKPFAQSSRRMDEKTGIERDENEESSGSINRTAKSRLLHAYAAALLAQIPCMRMEDVSGRAKLLCHPGLAGIVYHSVRFCDYYSFEYAKIRRETDLPILKIESDYTAQSEGQLLTRLQAFGETFEVHQRKKSGGSLKVNDTNERGRMVGDLKVPVNAERKESPNPERNPYQKGDNVAENNVSDVTLKPGGKKETLREIGQKADVEKERDSVSVFIGIDSGSTTTNGAAMDAEGNLLASSIIRTGARAGDAANRVLHDLKEQLGIEKGTGAEGTESRKGNLRTGEAAGDRREDGSLFKERTRFKEKQTGERSQRFRVAKIVATGYGRDHIDFADEVKTEITCHARGAHFLNPEARTVIDIGGQDSKVICLDEDGNVTNFVMNDKCAAGTGRFLEMMAHTLELDLDRMSEMGLTWKKDLTITSTCTVFAESEVVSLIAENSDTNDIIHALNKSVARKTRSMVKRVQGKEPYMMTGGVARNEGVVKELERELGAPISVMEHPDLTGAIGAALFARDDPRMV